MTQFDMYDIGVRVKEIDPDLSISWNDRLKKHQVFWKEDMVLTNPFPALDARLLTKIREIDTWSRQYSYNPERAIRESEEAAQRSKAKALDDLTENLGKDALGALKHDMGGGVA